MPPEFRQLRLSCLVDQHDHGGHRIVGTLEGYVEFYSNVSAERNADWIGTFDFGATYKLTPNVQLDAGVNIGLTRSADDVNPFVGLTVRY